MTCWHGIMAPHSSQLLRKISCGLREIASANCR
uniref:Uncharacterized protein n=1 Tax=Arundo donax TaxID=35708 RepID=A0A0A9GS15_ARUDO